MEHELEFEQKSHQESVKEVRKNERKLKELAIQSESDHKNHAQFQEQLLKLDSKLKQYKLQVEETEVIANLNLAKFRKAQSAYESVSERADVSESTIKSNLWTTVTMSRVVSPGVSYCEIIYNSCEIRV